MFTVDLRAGQLFMLLRKVQSGPGHSTHSRTARRAQYSIHSAGRPMMKHPQFMMPAALFQSRKRVLLKSVVPLASPFNSLKTARTYGF